MFLEFFFAFIGMFLDAFLDLLPILSSSQKSVSILHDIMYELGI